PPSSTERGIASGMRAPSQDARLPYRRFFLSSSSSPTRWPGTHQSDKSFGLAGSEMSYAICPADQSTLVYSVFAKLSSGAPATKRYFSLKYGTSRQPEPSCG